MGKIGWRALRNPEVVARVLIPDERNYVKDFLMYDKCTRPGQPCRWRKLYAGSVRRHVCTATWQETAPCPFKTYDYFPPLGPTVFTIKPDRDYPLFRKWCEVQIERIAEQEDQLGAVAKAWLLEDYSALDAIKPKRKSATQWHIECQKELYKEVANTPHKKKSEVEVKQTRGSKEDHDEVPRHE